MGAVFIWLGVYFAFFWPKSLRRAIAAGKTLPQYERFIRWIIPSGIFLIFLSIAWIALALTGFLEE
jgi:hypothetical protein